MDNKSATFVISFRIPVEYKEKLERYAAENAYRSGPDAARDLLRQVLLQNL